MNKITKNNISFNISGSYSESWFSNNKLDRWELDTFHILDYYKNNKESIYIDIGAWIGPTVLYAANIYKKVIAIEPDPIAIERLEQNLSVNNFNNISLIKKGLADKTGKCKFGSQGCGFGNSESTILVSNDKYSSWGGRHSKEKREENIIEIETIVIEELLESLNISPLQISLIKMDIEGGELILIPYLQDFLKKYKPVFYISLHPCFLKPEHIEQIINILFDIYDNCYYFSSNGIKIKKNKDEVIKDNLTSIVFE